MCHAIGWQLAVILLDNDGPIIHVLGKCFPCATHGTGVIRYTPVYIIVDLVVHMYVDLGSEYTHNIIAALRYGGGAGALQSCATARHGGRKVAPAHIF